MAKRIRYIFVIVLLILQGNVVAGGNTRIPSECRNLSHTVALIDCLQNQLEILQYALNYHQTASKITDLLSNHKTEAPAAVEEKSVSDPVIDRINWFDQHLEIYAVVGSSDNLTALGRIGDRHYRLQEGDSIRLAKVQKIHTRGLTLSFANHEFSIGLTGRTLSLTAEYKHNEQ